MTIAHYFTDRSNTLMTTKKKPAAKAPKKKPAAPKKAGKPAAKKPAEKKSTPIDRKASGKPAKPAKAIVPAAAKTVAIETLPPLNAKECELRVKLEKVVRDGMQAFRSVGEALIEIRDKVLYRGDYGTFEEYAAAEFKLSKSEAYRVINAEKVAAQIETVAPHLPPLKNKSVARPLESVPPEQQAPIYAEAVEVAGGEAPTAAQVQQVVDEHKTTESSTTTTTTALKPKDTFGFTDETLKKDLPLAEALKKIAEATTPNFVKAIKQGVIQLKRGDVFTLSAMKAEEMRQCERLLSIQRWDIKRATRFLAEMPGTKTTVEALINLCIADGGSYEATIEGYNITVTGKPKKA